MPATNHSSLGNRWLRSGPHNPCPVCDRIKDGDCRIKDGLVLCHTYPDADAGHSDWKWIKRSKDGLTGVYAPREDEQDFDRERLAKQQKQRLEQHRERLKVLPSIEAKDRANRGILDGLTLSDEDRERLRARGLTDTQIESIGYKSDPRGILCPITDHLGRVGGIKVWDWDAKDKSGKVKPGHKKYSWFGKAGENNLNDGHLPIAVYGAEQSHGVVAFTEGMEIKPALASARLNLPVIGTNGSNFVGSWQRKKEALEAMGASIARIYPDAGAVTNPQLVEQYRHLIRRAQADGYEVQIAWWGQFLKQTGDIDEIDDRTLAKIRYLTPDEFEGMVRIGEYYRQYLESTRLTQKGSGAVKLDEISSQYFSPELEVFRSGKGHGIKGGMGTGKTTAIYQAIIRQLEGIGLINLGYRNTLQEQFSAGLERFSDGERTAKHVSQVNDFWLNPGQCIRLCVDSLLRLPCWEDEDTKTVHYFDGKYILLDEVNAVVKHLLFSGTLKEKRFEVLERFSLALQRCAGFVYADANLADWVVQFLGEISGKPQELTVNTHHNTKASLTLLEATIEGERIRRNDDSPWLLDMVQGAKQGKSFAVASDSQNFIESLEQILTEEHGVVTRIIRIDGKTTEQRAIKEFIREAERLLEEQRGEAVLLLFTTSAESGIDIPNRGLFSTVYGFHFGVIDSEQFTQMLGRIRDQEAERKVWVRTHSISDEEEITFNSQIMDYLEKKFLAMQSNLLFGEVPSLARLSQEVESKLDIEKKTAYLLKDLRNFEKRNLRDCTIQRLIQCGYNLKKVTIDRTPAMSQVKDCLSGAKESVKRQNCHDVANAMNDFIGRPYQPTSVDATWDERCAKEKAMWFDRLPGFWGDESDPTTYYTMETDHLYLFKYAQPGLVRGMELLHLSQNLDQAKTISQNRYLRMLERGGIVPWEVSTPYLKARALSHLPLVELIEALESGPVTADSELAQKIMALVQKRFMANGRKVTLFSVLKKRPGKCPLRYLAHICKLIGLPARIGKVEGTECLALNKSAWGEIKPILEDLRTAIAAKFTRLCTGEDFGTRAEKFVQSLGGQAKTLEPLPEESYSLKKSDLSPIRGEVEIFSSTEPENTEDCTATDATPTDSSPYQWQPYRDSMAASPGQWVNHVVYGVCRVEDWGRLGINLSINGVPIPPCDSGQITHLWEPLSA